MITATAAGVAPGLGHESSWQREWREAVTDPAELLALLGLTRHIAGVAFPGRREFPLRVPRRFVARMRHGDPDDPLLRQVLPLDAERLAVEGYGVDAVGDLAARHAPGVIQKYRGRALLIATGSCAVHCRYCFRRHFPYAEETAATARWQPAVDWLRTATEIDEVILSGGDPLALSNARLADLVDALRDIPHVRRLRFHTRLPVVLPARVDDGFAALLEHAPWPVAVVLHANHANELDAEVAHAVAELRAAGATVLNQAVILRGVNDAVAAQCALAERSFAIGVLPYYLHVLDRVAGSAHFDVPEARAVAIHEGMRARLPGYLLPRLVREVAGEASKTPVTIPPVGKS